MPKLPDKITVDLQARRVMIDGEELPWYLEDGGVGVYDLGGRDRLPIVELRIPAVTVEVIPAEPPG